MKIFKAFFCCFLSINLLSLYCVPTYAQEVETISVDEVQSKIESISILERNTNDTSVSVQVSFNDDSNISNPILYVNGAYSTTISNPVISNSIYTFTSNFELGDFTVQGLELTYGTNSYYIDLSSYSYSFTVNEEEVEEKTVFAPEDWTVVTSQEINPKTVSNAMAWLDNAANNHIGYDMDGVYDEQCVDLAQAYAAALGSYLPSLNGKEYLGANRSDWQVSYDAPQPGDICVYTDAYYGHVSIYGENGYTYHQNYGGVSYVQKVHVDYNGLEAYGTYYIGCLHYTGWESESTFVNQSPIGYLDTVTVGEGYIDVTGWALDKNSPSESLSINVYVGSECHTIAANTLRSDVNNVYGLGSYHGFSSRIYLSCYGTQTLTVKAVDANTLEEQTLTNGSKSITCIQSIAPTINDVAVLNLSDSGYALTISASDNVGVTSVQVKVWTASETEANGVIGTATSNGSCFTYTVLSSDHNNEKNCTYYTKIVAYDAVGNSVTKSMDTIFVPYGNEHLEGYSLTLTGEIGVNFYMTLSPGAISQNAYMLFTLLDGSTQKVYVSDATRDGDYYIFTCTVGAKDMTSLINARLYSNSGSALTDSYIYTVQDYANYIIKNYASTSNEYKIAKAMLTYGYYAQDYFGYNTSSLPTNTNPVGIVTLDNYQYQLTDNNSSIDYIGARLLLGTKPGLKLYFRGSADFKVDGTPYTTSTEGNYTVITLNNVSDIYHMYTITTTTDDFSLSYSVASYGNLALNGNNNSLRNLIRAMVAYYKLFK